MSAYIDHTAHAQPGPISRAVSWMDERGPISWIILTVGSFIFAGPLGLLVLGFVLMTGRFSRRNFAPRSYQSCGMRMHVSRGTGNRAFDSYKADTIARLEREQAEFEAFLARLREARDKAEFDQYMDERSNAPSEDAETGEEGSKSGAY